MLWISCGRFFELKTVQIMDGDELAACVNKPCIKADGQARIPLPEMQAETMP